MQSPNAGAQLATARNGVLVLNASQIDFEATLRAVMVLLGIRAANWPTAEETAILLDFVRRNYSGFTLAEIRLSFEMAITSKLEVDSKHYENFSCEYFGRIMSAYKDWSREEIRFVTEKPKDAVKGITQEANWAAAWANMKERAKTQPVNSIVIPAPIYDYLVEQGILVLSADDKKRLWREQKIEYGKDLQTNYFKNKSLIERLHSEDLNKDEELFSRISLMAKKAAVTELLTLKQNNNG